MALGASYATTAELKTRVNETSSTFDTQIGEALATASRLIEKMCNRQFNVAASATARVFYPRDAYCAKVDDISTASGLIVKTDGGDGTYATTWASSEYQLEPLNGVVNGETGWPYYIIRALVGRTFPYYNTNTVAPLQVTATWGWAAVPAAVKEACLMLAEEQYKLKDAPFGVAGFGAYGPLRVRTNPKVAEMLAPYTYRPVLMA